nr:MAG TPA: hypothetical protein [Caudoviricetes sp.]
MFSLTLGLYFFRRRNSIVSAGDGVDDLVGEVSECFAGDGVFESYGASAVARRADVGHKRNLRQQGHTGLFGQARAAVVAENIITFVGMGSRGEPRHILDNAENRHVDLVAGEHRYPLAGVGESDFLRGGDNDRAGDTEGLHERQMDVARARRHIDEEIVELAPVGVADELAQGVACHGAAPEHGLVGVDHEAYRQNLDSMALGGNYEVAAVDLVDKQLGFLKPEHFRNRRAEDVGVEQTDTVAFAGESNGEVAGYGRFPDASLAARYADDIFHTGQRIDRFLGYDTTRGQVYLNLDIASAGNMDSGLAGFGKRFAERIGRTVENERETDVAPVDAQIVGYHVVLDNAVSVAGIAHCCQSVEDKFGIELFSHGLKMVCLFENLRHLDMAAREAAVGVGLDLYVGLAQRSAVGRQTPAKIFYREAAVDPLALVVGSYFGQLGGSARCGIVEVGDVGLGRQGVFGDHGFCIGVEKRAVGLEIDGTAGSEHPAVETAEARSRQPLGSLLHLGVGECYPYFGDLARSEEAVEQFYRGAQESGVGYAAVAHLCRAAPHSRALDVDSDEVAVGKAFGEADGVFPFAASELKHYGVGIAEDLGSPAAAQRTASGLFESAPGELEDAVERLHLAEFAQLILSHSLI